MKRNVVRLAVGALVLLSAGAFAQTGPQHKKHLTPEQRAERRAERQEKLANMSPAERAAFKQAQREKREAKLNAMTPEQRERVLARKKLRKEQRKQQG